MAHSLISEAGPPTTSSPSLISPSAPPPHCWSAQQAVCLLLRQFDGLKAGYRARRAELQAQAAALALQAEGGASSAAAAAAAAADAVGDKADGDFLFM